MIHHTSHTARRALGTALLLGLSSIASVASADEGRACMSSRSDVSLERRLRQVSLDLLGRPPTMDEYAFVQRKGEILEEDLSELMTRDEFYARLKGYHRGLLRANISASIYNNGDLRLNASSDGLQPLEFRGNPGTALRGKNGSGCDHFVEQDKCDLSREDPHLEPATKTCRDEMGVPMPVSVDYNTENYTCTRIAGAVTCQDALTKKLLADKHELFCDNRRVDTAGTLRPHLCLPQQNNAVTAALTEEVFDEQGRVIAFRNPAPPPGQLARLDRCTLDMSITGGVRGRYTVQRGCVQKEGVVTVTAPYFEKTKPTVTMCAIEAQTNAVNPWTLETCESGRFTSDRSCGCGANGRRCDDPALLMHKQRIAAVNEEPLRIIDSVVRRDESYFNILTTRRSFVNGALSQLYRENQTPTMWLATSPADRASIPNVPIEETDTWVEYTRAEHASGVLTTPEWLYRFPTQRSRVSQFWDVFLCKHFSPPADAVVPAPEDSCNRDNNLATRCGCSYCHATIEPIGAHWGRFGERNAQYLDPSVFPKTSTKCRDCALAGNTSCDNECGNYVMQAFDGDGANSLGLLRTYLYRTQDEEPNIVGGPKLLVERMMQTGDLERCAVRNVWNHLLGRPMTTDEEHLYLNELVDQFAMSNHNLKTLMRKVVSTDAYRRVD